jgi:hypothetical protein
MTTIRFVSEEKKKKKRRRRRMEEGGRKKVVLRKTTTKETETERKGYLQRLKFIMLGLGGR